MKLALVHDYIKEYGGAERVLEALHELYPDAPVYTSVFLPAYLGPHEKRFSRWDIRTSMAQHLPWKEKLISPLRILAPWLFSRFDFSEYDVILTSATGAYFPNALVKKSAVLVSYCHTPPRYLYGFATAREWKKNLFFRILGETANYLLRMEDAAASQNVDYYIANSTNVQKRIQKFYEREAVVIYPPVDVEELRIKNNELRKKNHNSSFMLHDSYYLAGGRLARPKHIDLIVKMAVKNNLPLKVFGREFAGYGAELRSHIARRTSHVEFVGEVTDAEKYELMRNAKAFIFAAEDEDFGITPVEAMACGVPVVAYRSGGVVESVVDGKTGLFFDTLSEDSLFEAIQKLEKLKISPKDCRDNAQRFNKERFKTQIQLFLASIHQEKAGLDYVRRK